MTVCKTFKNPIRTPQTAGEVSEKERPFWPRVTTVLLSDIYTHTTARKVLPCSPSLVA